MKNVLDEILANKRLEVERARADRPIEALTAESAYMLPRRNFYGAVTAPHRKGPNLIAEIKRASPSAGIIIEDFDAERIAAAYAAGGADALSVLTDRKYFDGRPEYIERVKSAVGLPVLRKDFIVDAYQVYESRALGADAILLIAEALEEEALRSLIVLARELELCVLMEVHSRDTLLNGLRCLDAQVRKGVLLGINNRDLQRQVVDLATTEQLAELVTPGLPIVSESGIKTRQDVVRLHGAGARALLIGETLMRSGDPATTIRELLG